jgi:DNA-binding transcriptional MerR regulator
MAGPGAAQKSPEAFRTISEIAVELEVPQHVLRFWETKFATVRPLKRGGGRRYYRPEDVDLLRGIRSLLYRDGLTTKGVQKILRERGARYVMDLGRGATDFHIVERPSNIHKFPRGTSLNESERQRFANLLDELVQLKQRLHSHRPR